MKRVAIVLGTRPETIKMSPVIRECEKRGLDYFILHTGQHYSYNMDRVFFEQLELRKRSITWMLVLEVMLNKSHVEAALRNYDRRCTER